MVLLLIRRGPSGECLMDLQGLGIIACLTGQAEKVILRRAWSVPDKLWSKLVMSALMGTP